ncbi:hypothetical protein CSUI_009673 [Cystoisospora suis]|uniref:Transmembrane protein n=1 Tax=Cystoisospora suis TaxID=483139 RepID=A0A2C6JFZ8_9APIC|nr:hypothetical protein CSUI_009673 [Cystoisospora suis]
MSISATGNECLLFFTPVVFLIVFVRRHGNRPFLLSEVARPRKSLRDMRRSTD